MKDVKWIDGAPEKIEPGMLVLVRDGEFEGVWIAGSEIDFGLDEHWFAGCCIAWAWLIQPHEIEWLESMAKAHKVGRPAEGEGK
jgi:hypothetical protein